MTSAGSPARPAYAASEAPVLPVDAHASGVPAGPVEPGPQRRAGHGGTGVEDLQQAVARGAAHLRVGLGELVAAAGAPLPRPAHAPASFSTSFRIPPAVTAGPAPGPVITS